MWPETITNKVAWESSNWTEAWVVFARYLSTGSIWKAVALLFFFTVSSAGANPFFVGIMVNYRYDHVVVSPSVCPQLPLFFALNSHRLRLRLRASSR